MATEEANALVAPPAPNGGQIAAAAGMPPMQPQQGGAQGAFSSASLYVGDLHPDVTEAILFDIFNSVGSVASIRVCRDNMTRRSLGYAYVNFHHAADAERALDSLNYHSIKGRACRIMWSQRDPMMRRSGKGNIIIKNLDKDIDNKALYDTFSNFGDILSCKVVTDETGASKGFGFVHFNAEEGANLAIENVNGMMMNDKIVAVENFVPRKERIERQQELAKRFTNVFVKNLPEGIDEAKLSELCSPFGKIASAIVMKNEDGTSKGFGFVSFEDHDSAAEAVEALNGKDIDGKVLFAGRAQKKNEREAEVKQKYEAVKLERMSKYQGVNVYVKNLEENVDEERLRQEFSACGTITSCKVMRDEKGTSRGFGFVCFSSNDEAARAVTELNGKIIGSKPLYVALAQRKEERRQQLAAQYAQRQNAMRMQAGAAMASPMYASGAPMFYTAGAPYATLQRAGLFYPQQMQVARPPRYMAPAAVSAARPMYPPMAGMYGMAAPNMMAARGRGRPTRPPRAPMMASGLQAPPMSMQPPGPARGRGYPTVPPRPVGVRPGVPGQPGMPLPAATAAVPTTAPGQEQLTSSMLAQADPVHAKQMLGERLFPLIQGSHGDLAGKITGMLLEMDNGELLHLLESQEALNDKVNEAVVVLREHQAQAGGASA